MASPFFGGIPATGAIARTATNIRSGGTTPVAGIIHAAALLIILLVAAPLARFVPLAALAAVLMVVAYHMGAWHEIARIVRLSKADIAVWLTTFGLTAFADLTVAVGVGMALAALLYIYRITQTTTVETVTSAAIENGKAHVLHDKIIPSYVSIVRIQAVSLWDDGKIGNTAADVGSLEHIVIVSFGTCRHWMQRACMPSKHLPTAYTTRAVSCSCAARWPLRLLKGSTFLRHLGVENLLPNIESALARAEAHQ